MTLCRHCKDEIEPSADGRRWATDSTARGAEVCPENHAPPFCHEPRQCFYIQPGQGDPELGYVPSLVTEGEATHSPMTGRGELSQPWYWGTDYDKAVAVCEQANHDTFGLSPEQTKDIVDSSITASIREDARRQRYTDEIERKLGRSK